MAPALRWRWFALAAVTVNLLVFLLVRAMPRPAVQFGSAVDVAVTVPLLYFLLIVRGGLQPIISVLPLFLLGALRATYLAPGVATTRPLVGVAAELGLAAFVVYRLRRGLGARPASLDMLERLGAAAREIVPAPRLAAILASEMAVFYYAFGAWRRAPEVPEGTRGFSIHRESGVAALFGMLAAVSVMEAGLVHLVVTRWSAPAAWVLSALSAYATVWLVAVARAFVLRPILLRESELVVRGGITWTVHVPLEMIAGVETCTEARGLRIPLAAQPNLRLQFTRPVTAHGMYGITRRITSLALAVDDRDALLRALSDGV
jgi:hypothetical protein